MPYNKTLRTADRSDKTSRSVLVTVVHNWRMFICPFCGTSPPVRRVHGAYPQWRNSPPESSHDGVADRMIPPWRETSSSLVTDWRRNHTEHRRSEGRPLRSIHASASCSYSLYFPLFRFTILVRLFLITHPSTNRDRRGSVQWTCHWARRGTVFTAGS